MNQWNFNLYKEVEDRPHSKNAYIDLLFGSTNLDIYEVLLSSDQATQVQDAVDLIRDFIDCALNEQAIIEYK